MRGVLCEYKRRAAGQGARTEQEGNESQTAYFFLFDAHIYFP